ncbi:MULTISPECIES: zinc-dependent alcohol dehydrogenase family protein [Thioclava]|uniref:Alcohol dehydrogenase n=1 Tax=Thioclava nitratireducens TaxID=1915078 RepID=A0ABM6IDN2_9RHOB|nr:MULTISPECIES: zinc-dependent alcohol dehydrogenase family protein [Thioclava]AQS46842.1 alcohol dehydrogenase [Thioclava nitratireducens]OWY00793.1 alcohol dehydrogenase [Thioclava sp. IC9]OWY01303.1 alcohol dehydrogenase [Thioclava sp. F1Mire-8]OWY11641.1 alcohol dehydrogenase [Thioclava sp. F34-6]OWY15646.1 alcohol dehydrogenase [Thioclava sp. JM3]
MKTRIALLREMGKARPYTDSQPLEIVEAELDDPGPGELLIKMSAAGLCHSDLSVINGDRPRDMPVALGHEAAGVVEAVGPHVTRFAPGDHVVLVFAPSCGHCVPCAEGRPALCEPAAVAAGKGSLITGSKRISVAGEHVNHHIGVSAFSDYAVVSEASCVKIDKSIPLDQAALLGCAVLTGVGAVLNSGGLKTGQSCAIIGLGGVGLAGLLGAVAAGARTLVAVDLAKDKRDLALKLGATHAIDPTEEGAVQKLRDLTGGGVDLAVELAGAAPALQFAYAITRRGGTTVTAGLPNPKAEFTIPAVSLTANEHALKGSYMGSCVPVRDIPRFAQMMVQGQLPIPDLMTHRLKLEDINEGFERLAAGEAIRQVIVFD